MKETIFEGSILSVIIILKSPFNIFKVMAHKKLNVRIKCYYYYVMY